MRLGTALHYVSQETTDHEFGRTCKICEKYNQYFKPSHILIITDYQSEEVVNLLV